MYGEISKTEMTTGIYSITNTQNGRQYIGSSSNVEARWEDHRYWLDRGEHINQHLQSSWKKYGRGSFRFDLIEECKESELLRRERYYIRRCPDRYNVIIPTIPSRREGVRIWVVGRSGTRKRRRI